MTGGGVQSIEAKFLAANVLQVTVTTAQAVDDPSAGEKV